MSRPIKDRTRRICVAYQARLAAGESVRDVIGTLSADFDIQRPGVWKALRAGGVIAPYATKVEGGHGRPVGGGEPGYTAQRNADARTASERREDRMISSRPATFEPCGFCGTRADIGCVHQPPSGPKPLAIERGERRA